MYYNNIKDGLILKSVMGEMILYMGNSSRNKTINTSVEEGKKYLSRCICVSEINGHNDILDKTLKGDCLEALDKIESESIDLVIADPPYNMRKSFNGNTFSKMQGDDYEEYTRRWMEKVKRVLKKNGSVYVCCDWESSIIIGKVMSELFLVKNRITWQREKGRGAKRNWKNSLEDVWFAVNGENYKFNLGAVKIKRKVLAPYQINGKPRDWMGSDEGKFRDTCPSNFWDDITVPFWSMPENTSHPTQKPEKLIAKMILASSDEGDIVLDPFLGSGTTSVTAKKLGRHYIGIERDEQYCVFAEERLEMADNDKTIQGYSDGVFWERNTFSEQLKNK